MAENSDEKRSKIAEYISEVVRHEVDPDMLVRVSRNFTHEYEVWVLRQGDGVMEEKMLVSCWYREDHGYSVALMPNPWLTSSRKLQDAGITVKEFR